MDAYVTNIFAVVSLRNRPRPMRNDAIYFLDEDLEHVANPHEGALVITIDIDRFDVKRILVDYRSSTYILFLEVLLGMGKLKTDLKNVEFALIGFT